MKKFLSLCLSCALLCSMLAACGKTEEIEAPAGMKLASDTSVVDYCLFVPQKWVVDLSTGVTSAYHSIADPTSITVNVYGVDASIPDADTYFKTYEKAFEEVFGEMQNVTSSNLLLDGKDAMQYEYAASFGGTDYSFLQVVCIKNSFAYVLTYTSVSDNFEKHIEDMQAAVNTFRFIA